MRRAASLVAMAIACGGSTAMAQQPPQLPPPPPPPPGSSSSLPPLPPPSSSSQGAPAHRDTTVAQPTQRSVRTASPPPVAPVVVEREERDERAGPPPAHVGFQIALRTGLALPFGSIQRDAKMSDLFGAQVPIFAELGGKPIPNLFLGGYIGLGIGGSGGAASRNQCNGNVTCAAASFRLGIEAQWHFRPAERLNPWVGYGIGIESAGLGISEKGSSAQTTYAFAGLDFARFSGGLDIRLTHVIAIGPYVDVTFGRYSTQRVDIGGATTSTDVTNGATHGWFVIGPRVTFLP